MYIPSGLKTSNEVPPLELHSSSHDRHSGTQAFSLWTSATLRWLPPTPMQDHSSCPPPPRPHHCSPFPSHRFWKQPSFGSASSCFAVSGLPRRWQPLGQGASTHRCKAHFHDRWPCDSHSLSVSAGTKDGLQTPTPGLSADPGSGVRLRTCRMRGHSQQQPAVSGTGGFISDSTSHSFVFTVSY